MATERQRFVTENIDAYMGEIKRFPRISRDEETSLGRQLRNGTSEEKAQARNKLIHGNLRLVVKIAHSFKYSGIGFADLVAEGNIGLMTATDKFDPENGAKFSCYAAWWIKQSMRKAIAWHSRTIRMPGQSGARLSKLNKARSAFMVEHDRMPTADELAELSGLSVKQVRELMHCVTETLSMNDRMGDDDSTYEQMLADEPDDERKARECAEDRLHAAIGMLSSLERSLVTGAYGIGRPIAGSITLAQETGLSLASVKSRLDSALAHLRELMTAPAQDYAW